MVIFVKRRAFAAETKSLSSIPIIIIVVGVTGDSVEVLSIHKESNKFVIPLDRVYVKFVGHFVLINPGNSFVLRESAAVVQCTTEEPRLILL